MPDLKVSETPELDEVSGTYLIPIVAVSGNTKTNKHVTAQNFLAMMDGNAHVEGKFSSSNGAVINGDMLDANAGAILRGQSNVYSLHVANTHMSLANTFTPTNSDVSGTMPTGVHFFADSTYLYISINGTAKRVALSSF